MFKLFFILLFFVHVFEWIRFWFTNLITFLKIQNSRWTSRRELCILRNVSFQVQNIIQIHVVVITWIPARLCHITIMCKFTNYTSNKVIGNIIVIQKKSKFKNNYLNLIIFKIILFCLYFLKEENYN